MVIQAALCMQLEAASQGSMLSVRFAENHAPQPGMHQGHGAHGARLMHDVAVVASAEVRPACPAKTSHASSLGHARHDSGQDIK